MFYYFGYGSNINLISLRAKGVEPISSERGILRGWKLKFNVQHWFQHEGGVGNIQPSTDINDYVEGMVHCCKDEHQASLDAMESYGVGYDRIEVNVETANGLIRAQAYIGLPAFLDENCLPTRRYLNIIIKGAEAAGLSKPYLEKLHNHPLYLEEAYPEFIFPLENPAQFNEQTLALNPKFTALAGAVFDMRGARTKLDCLHDLFGGKDMTIFHLKRHDTSNGNETIEDFKKGNITDGQKKYINSYLHEYVKEFKYIGRYVYVDESLMEI
jgi:sulfite reductase (NADPH) flavoprotein alpha-component